MRVDSREDNLCVFCKYWLGKKADVSLITGKGKMEVTQGLCAASGSNKQIKSNSRCYRFDRDIIYC